ncbi:MAG: PEP-CTERM system histidine kinase PrsK [Gammaproteobacteria bacterium]|nr:PEP-CTERM system histidine kinase PrsK [Gammaproteobacteria bacterium]
MTNIGFYGYAIGSLLFLILSILLFSGRKDRYRNKLFLLATIVSSLWMAVVAYYYYGGYEQLLFIPYILELLRDFTWIVFLAHLLITAYSKEDQLYYRFRSMVFLTAAFVLLLIALISYRMIVNQKVLVIYGVDFILAGNLLFAVFGLVLVEQLFRNVHPQLRRLVKFICIGAGGLFAYDFYLYADALMIQSLNPELLKARGFVNAVVVPVLGLVVAMDPRLTQDVFISRRIVFHTAALIGAGVYLLAMGAGGYYVRIYGGNWGAIAQIIFLFGALLLLVVLMFSDQLRARLRIFINKHFFHYKYDYRDEWLRFIGTLSSGEVNETLPKRVVRAMGEVINSPGGILWTLRDGKCYEVVASWNMDYPDNTNEAPDNSLPRFLKEQQWVINMDEYRREPYRYQDLTLPDWIYEIKDAWVINPLFLGDDLIGFVILSYPPAREHFNWEDCDLLKTLGKQVASHLAQQESSEALFDAQQFEASNRLSSYVMHDLKNLIAQLSLVVSNAARHKHNPAFMEDAISTVDNSVTKMNDLLAHLRTGEVADNKRDNVELCSLLQEVVETMSAGRPIPSLDCQATGISANANAGRLSSILGHIIRNAQDATDNDGSIIVRLFKQHGLAVVEVQDTGAGMSKEFIAERLFRPFDTTKGKVGTGVGACETRDFVRAMGGEVEVISREGEGTSFRVRIPISDEEKNDVK